MARQALSAQVLARVDRARLALEELGRISDPLTMHCLSQVIIELNGIADLCSSRLNALLEAVPVPDVSPTPRTSAARLQPAATKSVPRPRARKGAGA